MFQFFFQTHACSYCLRVRLITYLSNINIRFIIYVLFYFNIGLTCRFPIGPE